MVTTMSNQSQFNQFEAISNISIVKVALHGLYERAKNGHIISEFEIAGLENLLQRSIELIEAAE